MNYNLISRIQLLIDRDKLDLAQEKLTEALASFPDSSELHALQATLYLNKENYPAAKKSVSHAISLNPEEDYYYYLNSRIASETNNDKEALNSIDQAIHINPQFATYYGMKSAILIDQKKFKEAIFFAKKGLDIDPDDLMANNMLSLAYNKTGKTDEAYDRLEGMLAGDPENILTQANMGYHFLRQGNIPKAKEHFAIALHHDPQFEFARAGMMEAIKGTNFLYAKLLQFSFWMERIGNKNRWLFIIGILFVIRILPFLLPFYLIFIFWTWFTGPISEILLYFDKYGRYLMTPLSLRLTQINIVFLTASIISLTLGIFFHYSFFILAFALFLTLIPVFLLETATSSARKFTLLAFATLFSGAGFYGIYHNFLMNEISASPWLLLIFSAVAFSWIASIVK